jgi:hypothetical protein
MAEERSAFFLINRGLHNSPEKVCRRACKHRKTRRPVIYLADFLPAAKSYLTI